MTVIVIDVAFRSAVPAINVWRVLRPVGFSRLSNRFPDPWLLLGFRHRRVLFLMICSGSFWWPPKVFGCSKVVSPVRLGLAVRTNDFLILQFYSYLQCSSFPKTSQQVPRFVLHCWFEDNMGSIAYDEEENGNAPPIYHKMRGVFERRNAAQCASHLLPYLEPNHNILDIGCGPGSITLDLARQVPQGRVVGVDIDEGIPTCPGRSMNTS